MIDAASIENGSLMISAVTAVGEGRPLGLCGVPTFRREGEATPDPLRRDRGYPRMRECLSGVFLFQRAGLTRKKRHG